jgi:group I intron endonuclease
MLSCMLHAGFIHAYHPACLQHAACSMQQHTKFSLEILEYCKPEDAIKREQYYLDFFKPEYNILKKAGSTLGYKHTEETRLKMMANYISKNLGGFAASLLRCMHA